MKTQRISSIKSGFTLVELLVAMFITTIIISVLVSITSISLDTWNRSRSELRAARQAKAMIDTMARDFESLVTRKGNTNEWLSAIADDNLKSLGDKLTSTSATKLIFFTAVTDRYNGDIGSNTDKGGDVSCVAYELAYQNPIDKDAGGKFDTFVLYRLLVNPDDTFKDLLGVTQTDPNKAQTSLKQAFSQYDSNIKDPGNFVCENIYQFSLTYYVQYNSVDGNGQPVVKNTQVVVNDSNQNFFIQGTGIVTQPEGMSAPELLELAAGRVTAVQISTTVLTDFGVEQSKSRSFANDAAKAKFFSQNSYQYSKVVQIPSM